MLISVVIPCFNCEKTIKRCLDSISSNKDDLEIILVNDCSTDDTLNVIKDYISDSKLNIKLINNEHNLGAGATRNIGIKSCTGEYIVFLDSDDCFVNDTIYTLKEKLEQKKYDVIIFDAYYNNKIMPMTFNKVKKSCELSMNDAFVYTKGCTCGKIYKTSIIKDNAIFFGKMKVNEDLVFTKIALFNSKNIYYLHKPLYKYISNDTSLMNSTDKKNIALEYAYMGFDEVKKRVYNVDKELNSIYYIEVVYSTSINLFLAKEKYSIRKKLFREMLLKHNRNDIYSKKYAFKYRFMILFFKIIYWRFERNEKI